MIDQEPHKVLRSLFTEMNSREGSREDNRVRSPARNKKMSIATQSCNDKIIDFHRKEREVAADIEARSMSPTMRIAMARRFG